MEELKRGDWVRVLPNEWSIKYKWNGQMGVVIHVSSHHAVSHHAVSLQSGVSIIEDDKYLMLIHRPEKERKLTFARILPTAWSILTGLNGKIGEVLWVYRNSVVHLSLSNPYRRETFYLSQVLLL